MAFIWDYDKNWLGRTKLGKIKLLERAINFGPDPGKKIKLSEVKKNWQELRAFFFI